MNVTCIICSDILNPSSEVYTTPCGHLFHFGCLIQWIERSKSCPQCRNKTTEKTIHRIYFNLANTDHIVDDVGTLQSKIDNIQFQMTLKEKDLNNFKEKYRKFKEQNAALRLEVSELEGKSKAHNSTVHALKDQIMFYKSKSKERDRLAEENSKLKNNLRTLESVQVAISGTREEVNDMLRSESDKESLLIMMFTMKKALLDAEKKKLNMEHKYKVLQNDFTKCRRDLTVLEASNAELSKQFESSKLNWGREKEYLTKMMLDSQNKESTNEMTDIKRIILESPAPIPKKLRPSSETITRDVESPSVEEKLTQILDSDSPYLPVKASSACVGLGPLHFSKISQQPLNGKKISIFKGSVTNIDGLNMTKGDEVACNGLGGQSKNESLFPSPNSHLGLKRSRIYQSTSSKKFKKLTPLFLNRK